MGPLRRVFEWLRDLDARYGYVKRARVVPGDPAPVRLRKVADTSEVVLVNPSPAAARSSYAPVARADVTPVPPAPPAVSDGHDEEDTGELPVITVASGADPGSDETDGPVPSWVAGAPVAEEPDRDAPDEPVVVVAAAPDPSVHPRVVEDEDEDEDEDSDHPDHVPPPAAPNPDAVSRLRSHRPD